MSSRKFFGRVSGVLLFALASLPTFAQEPSHQDQMLAKIEARRTEIRHHTEVLESIDDPDVLQREMQTHFLLTEELLGWIVEHQRHLLEAEQVSTDGKTAAAMGAGKAMGGMGREMGKKGMGHGKMMGMGMGGMGDRSPKDGGDSGSPSADGRSNPGSGATTGSASATASRIAEREALLQEISTHTLYLESLDDPRERATENVKHQLMLERLVDKMQQ